MHYDMFRYYLYSKVFTASCKYIFISIQYIAFRQKEKLDEKNVIVIIHPSNLEVGIFTLNC